MANIQFETKKVLRLIASEINLNRNFQISCRDYFLFLVGHRQRSHQVVRFTFLPHVLLNNKQPGRGGITTWAARNPSLPPFPTPPGAEQNANNTRLSALTNSEATGVTKSQQFKKPESRCLPMDYTLPLLLLLVFFFLKYLFIITLKSKKKQKNTTC